MNRALPPALGALATLVLHLSGALGPVELLTRDLLLRALPARTPAHVAVVLVDEEALRRLGPWPLGRGTLAVLVDRIVDAGARGVVVDILLPGAREGDDRLAGALGRGPSALAAGVDDTGAWLLPAPGLGAARPGHVSFDLDRDGVVRRFAATKEIGGRALPALPVAAARLWDPGWPVPVGATLRPGFRHRPVPAVGAAAVLDGAPGALRGRVVFLGINAAGVGDRFISPVSPGGSPDPGVVIEALSAEAVLSGDLLGQAPPLLTALLTFGLGLALGRWRRAWVALGLGLAPMALAAAALAWARLELAPLGILAGLLAAGALTALDRARQARRAMGAADARIAELERLQAGLARARLQDTEARRVVAHELKTPLTSMRGLAQLLAQFELSGPERERVARMVMNESSRLAQMVDALLDLERLALRPFETSAQPLDLSALVAGRVQILRGGSGRDVTADLEPGIRVLGDPALLERVLDNLTGNALKFSPGGALGLGLRRQGDWAVLEVRDQGPGIPPEERTRIFGRFARGQGGAPGLGLGLALVAEALAWHRGEVEADEAPGGGALFRARLPLMVDGRNL
ncbi:CHASE2 domain-containing protein [Mesoterricola silvestris]|uniref:histidine kinase n=1 Tax=Mesoterricola silvestris TaxID=2927979 RepID=A0AA48GL96_9BACT|nr:CHASE2 domain-containing protein [Mesoterricola silvestris]BDU71864.1 hypothetical protein METEAL_10380 [Mesoterricola silvestris]